MFLKGSKLGPAKRGLQVQDWQAPCMVPGAGRYRGISDHSSSAAGGVVAYAARLRPEP